MEATKSVFETLNAVNCNEHVERKNGLSYLSWAWAWQMVKSHFPGANYTIYEDANGRNYHTDGRTCWVKTGVEIDGLEHIEYLPVMDSRNRSIPADQVTSFDVNKAIQRSLTKACARHGLGLYIYAGEDLSNSAADAGKPKGKALTDAMYWKGVEKAAGSGMTSADAPIREWLDQYTNGADYLATFDDDVYKTRVALGLEK